MSLGESNTGRIAKFFSNYHDVLSKIGPFYAESDFSLIAFMVLTAVHNFEDFSGAYIGSVKQLYDYLGLASKTPYEDFACIIAKLITRDYLLTLEPIYNSNGEVIKGKYAWHFINREEE